MNETKIAGFVLSVLAVTAFAEPHLPGRDQLAGYRPPPARLSPSEAAAAADPTYWVDVPPRPREGHDPISGFPVTSWNQGLSAYLSRVAAEKHVYLTRENILKLTYAYKVDRLMAAGRPMPAALTSTQDGGAPR